MCRRGSGEGSLPFCSDQPLFRRERPSNVGGSVRKAGGGGGRLAHAIVGVGGGESLGSAATGDLLMWQHGKWSSAMANIKGHPGEVQCMLPAARGPHRI